MVDADTPFHAGELAAQKRAGADNIATIGTRYIRDFMPEQHRTFYKAQPFLVVASGDSDGQVWATLIEGPDGFIGSPDPERLTLDTKVDPLDPLAHSLQEGTDIGVVGIELATRRRNRLSGRTRHSDQGLVIDIRQTFGNCPQYINERDWWRAPRTAPTKAQESDHLSPDQIARIRAADTLFLGSGHHAPQKAASDGYDASHRGGEPGFVRVISPTRLRIPDYSGNNFFNTIGNLLQDPRVGLLFVDFATGGLLHLTGRAKIDWAPEEARDPNILRMIDVTIDAVIERTEALSLRWSADPAPSQNLTVVDKNSEAEGITSFHLAPAEGDTLPPFQAGQHLPIALEIPAHDVKIRRSYSLSGKPGENTYRITVKREPGGTASQFLHDSIKIGDTIEARPPAGDFLIPDSTRPLVLVSVGVGLTPMMAMLHRLAQQNTGRQVWFVHGARNGRHHALSQETDRLISATRGARKRVFFSQPDNGDLVGRDFDAEGRVTAAEVLALDAGSDALYMLCGPAGFVTDLKSGLEAAGIDGSQIHYETFGSA
jgi:hypothetical protein